MRITLNQNRLLSLLKDFYTLSHVRTVIYDSDFHRVAAYPEQSSDFCAMLKKNGDFRCRCRQNEMDACTICSRDDSLYIYRCHAGLIEAVAPIKMNDMILGYIMFGQIIHKNDESERILAYASDYTTDSEGLRRAFGKLKIRGDKQIHAIASIMQASASYLWIRSLIQVDGESHIYLLTDYIRQNITRDLSVDTLCSLLKISRVRLYELSNKYYGMSIGRYVRQKRVALAAAAMVEKNASVKDAAREAGYDDTNYFSKVFKREMGMMPTDYKKKHQAQKEE